MKITKSELLNLLASPIAYYSLLAKTFGGVECGVFLSQLIYWTGRGHDPDGWVWKTQDELFEETGLTIANQKTARKKLKAAGVLEEKREGIPARLYYRINLDAIFQQTSSVESTDLDQSNQPNSTSRITRSNTETTTETTTEKILEAMPQAQKPKSKRKKKPPHPQTQPILRAYETALGYPIASFPREAKGAKTLADNGYTPDEVVTCLELLRREPFWKQQHISLQSIATQIGPRLGKNLGGNGASGGWAWGTADPAAIIHGETDDEIPF